jgi:hypothetical protein
MKRGIKTSFLLLLFFLLLGYLLFIKPSNGALIRAHILIRSNDQVVYAEKYEAKNFAHDDQSLKGFIEKSMKKADAGDLIEFYFKTSFGDDEGFLTFIYLEKLDTGDYKILFSNKSVSVSQLSLPSLWEFYLKHATESSL